MILEPEDNIQGRARGEGRRGTARGEGRARGKDPCAIKLLKDVSKDGGNEALAHTWSFHLVLSKHQVRHLWRMEKMKKERKMYA